VQSRNSESDILNLSFKFQIAGRGAESGFWNARAGSWNLFNPLGVSQTRTRKLFACAAAPRSCSSLRCSSLAPILNLHLT
jgi:hypothetical protein